MRKSGERLAIDGGAPLNTEPFPTTMLGPALIGEEEAQAVAEVIRSKKLFRFLDREHSWCAELENRFKAMTGCAHALAVGGGTASLICGLVGIGVGEGDEVILPGYTYIASASAVLTCGAVPVIADIDASLTLDPNDIERNITKRTKAIMPVHMRGSACDMDRIMAIAKKHGLKVVEDVAQACGGSYKGRRLGSFGDCNAFSLQYHKIITAGEGGIVLTNDHILYDRARAYHDTAACWRPDLPRYEGEVFPGVNFRMSELHGAVALAQLRKLDKLVAGMRAKKKRIKDQITGIPGITFRKLNDEAGDTAICLIFFLKDGETTERFAKALSAEGVGAHCIYSEGVPDWHIYPHWKMIMGKVTATPEGCPYTCHYYTEKGGKAEYSPDMCPKTLGYLGRTIHLNIPPQMTDEDCDLTAKAIRKVARALL